MGSEMCIRDRSMRLLMTIQLITRTFPGEDSANLAMLSATTASTPQATVSLALKDIFRVAEGVSKNVLNLLSTRQLFA